MEDRDRHSSTAQLLTRTALLGAAGMVIAAFSSAQAVAAVPLGGGCSGAGMWVVCEAENGSSSSGDSGSHTRPSGSEGSSKPGKPVCTVERLDPQPPEGSMFWGDTSPEDGAVYQRTCNTGPGGTPVSEHIVAAEAPDATAVDPAVVAQQAVNKMKLAGPDIASPRTTGTYVVGMPMWLWVNKSPTTFGPSTTSASAGGVTVTATARVTRIVWEMGDGAAVTCTGAGTPYTAAHGKQESPNCGHTYTQTSASQPAGNYTVTATSTWTVDWQVAGGGEEGQFTEIRQSQAQVAIGELQVVR
ncbi:ATP/GTP-binding protein [Streptomyces anthocyanicus]|uniref:ATP/GTP-binding protein n=2 Tax=Streptomyces TaxID=1883 RepID=A0ABN3TGJ0_9ACTN|nr:ATP/GTP-binding protein [Streptomyces sp. RK76]GGL76164.1 ATP/GTP-binding protein [Streptomyces anthocyanicus]GHC33253.1 ATP/GTP-binding protein [Streptomyces anthocyanicus]